MSATTTDDRLAEIETIYGPIRPGIRAGLSALLRATDSVEIETPAAIFGSADGEVYAIWQHSSSRITAYVLEDSFLVEVVPKGPRNPFPAASADIAAAYMRGVLTDF